MLCIPACILCPLFCLGFFVFVITSPTLLSVTSFSLLRDFCKHYTQFRSSHIISHFFLLLSLVISFIFRVCKMLQFSVCQWPKDGKQNRVWKLSLSPCGYNRENGVKATKDDRRYHPVILQINSSVLGDVALWPDVAFSIRVQNSVITPTERVPGAYGSSF